MTCCGKKKPVPGGLIKGPFTVMGNYKYLNSQQIAKRLGMFKNLYCKECNTKEACTYEAYRMCEKAAKIENR